MNARLAFLFLLIVLLPLAALAGLGLKVARDERTMMAVRIQDLLAGQLREIDRRFAARIEAEALEMGRILEDALPERSALRELRRRHPALGPIFVLDATGRLLHPLPGEGVTQEEADFLAETRTVWTNGDLFHQTLRRSGAESGAAAGARERPPAEQGWYACYLGRDLALFFWLRRDGGTIIGAQVDRLRLLAELIAELPDTPEGAGGDRRSALVDANNEIVYQWGEYEPAPMAAPVARIPLSPPLGSWSLVTFVAPGSFHGGMGRGAALGAMTALLALGLVVALLAAGFYRENTRQLREAARRVSFVNQVSHELKTPLTNIRMYAELLDGEIPDHDEGLRRRVDIIVSESQRLSRLIGNILTFSRRDRGALRVHLAPGVLDETVRAVVESFRPVLEGKGIEIHIQLDAGGPVRLDGDAVEQILGNLISNVEKYAASGRFLSVTTRRDGDMSRVTVRDRGPGIPRAHRKRIFDAFYRIGGSLTEGVTGTGIGLSIARELARLHGGCLRLTASESGAVFEVVLHTPSAGESQPDPQQAEERA